MTRKIKQILLVSFDLITIATASILSYLFLNPYVSMLPRDIWLIILVTHIFYLLAGRYFQVYNKINRYVDFEDTLLNAAAVTIGFLFSSIFGILFIESINWRFMLLSYLVVAIIIPGSRVLWRILIEQYEKGKRSELKECDRHKKRTIIVGAGQGGSLFIQNLKRYNSEIELIGIVDDSLSKKNMFLYDVPVIGTVEEIPELVATYNIEQITIAIPSLKTEELKRIVNICTQTVAKINQMPSVEKVISGKYKVNKFKEIDVVSLLDREEVELDMDGIGKQLTNKTVLITGAGGSIGSEIARQILSFAPKRLLLLGNGENSIYLINKELKSIQSDVQIVPLIGDVQDRERMFSIMAEYKPAFVYHAAAHKHVPLMEYNPTEAIKNNIYGTKNIAEAAKKYKAETFVMISTDKAVNPPNVMGATKRISEMIISELNEENKTKFASVRFGNVLGSRGSVIPLFKEQIKKGGPVTVTDFRMTRYFMTIPEASRLAIQAGVLAEGGEIFLLDMGDPVKIIHLAENMIRLSNYSEKEIEIVETGIRPGEKLYEELLTAEERTLEQVYDKIFVGKVKRVPIKQVMAFLEGLEGISNEELKEKLIRFTNTKHREERIPEDHVQQEVDQIIPRQEVVYQAASID